MKKLLSLVLTGMFVFSASFAFALTVEEVQEKNQKQEQASTPLGQRQDYEFIKGIDDPQKVAY